MSKEKQIEEMACAICGNARICVGEGVEKCIIHPQMWRYANNAYREGYRKQSEGEWVTSDIPQEKYACSVCGGACWYYDYQGEVARSKYCPNCGAKMKGGAE